ncbi:MAG TPA: hypothetical protein V6C65_38275 [Allocoleopsis sp.]
MALVILDTGYSPIFTAISLQAILEKVGNIAVSIQVAQTLLHDQFLI